MISDRDLSRLMSEAARLATQACMQAGYSRSDRVTRDSAFAAADEVRRRERPVDHSGHPAGHISSEDGWHNRADVGG